MNFEGDLIDELRRLAGVPKLDRFRVSGAHHPIEVDYNGGSSSSLTLRADYDVVARADHPAIQGDPAPGAYRQSARPTALTAIRPLAVTLRSETPDDVEGKVEGVNVEFQTGDAVFDREVYVSTPTNDEAVLAAVLGPNVRQGVLALLVLGFQKVTIDDERGRVEAFMSTFASRQPKPGRGLHAIEAFDLVIANLPRVVVSNGAHPPVPWWTNATPLVVIAIAGLMLGAFPTMEIASWRQCTLSTPGSDGAGSSLRDGCGWPFLVALPIAVVLALLLRNLVAAAATKALRGRSDARERIGKISLSAFLATVVVTFIVAASIGLLFAHPPGG